MSGTGRSAKELLYRTKDLAYPVSGLANARKSKGITRMAVSMLPKDTVKAVLTGGIELFQDPEFVAGRMFTGQPTSQRNEAVLELLRLRRITEEMKAAESSSRAAGRANHLTFVNAVLTFFILVATAINVGITWRSLPP